MGSYLKILNTEEEELDKIDLNRIRYYDFHDDFLIEPITGEVYEVCLKNATFCIWDIITTNEWFDAVLQDHAGQFFVLKKENLKRLITEMRKRQQQENEATAHYLGLTANYLDDFTTKDDVKMMFWLE